MAGQAMAGWPYKGRCEVYTRTKWWNDTQKIDETVAAAQTPF